nr:ATP-grasp domain-containing protein [Candidatus Sigynarchaeota archaeon]
MVKDSILIVELTTAGAFGSADKLIQGISIEGLAMVKALVADAMAGNFDVHVVISSSIDRHSLFPGDAVHWHPVTANHSVKGVIHDLASIMAYGIVVAPEFGHFLEEYTGLLEASVHCLLTPSRKAVAAASDKLASLERISARGVLVPAAQSFPAFKRAPSVSFPVVVKPRFGAGCIGVFKVNGEKEIALVASAEKRLGFTGSDLVVQQYIHGAPLSASVVAARGECFLLGINEQTIDVRSVGKGESKYSGGVVGPLHPGLRDACGKIARAIVDEMPMDGYFGFDFILDEHGNAVVVEINPRFTTSFVGLKALQPFSFLRFMVDCKKKPGKPGIDHDAGFLAYTIFTMQHDANRIAPLEQARNDQRLHDLLVLPGPGEAVAAFLAAKGSTRDEAVARLASVVPSKDGLAK